MSVQMAVRTVLDTFERRRRTGYQLQKNGTQLAGHLPWIAPKAYLHELPSGIKEKAIKRMQLELGRDLPLEIKDLYLQFNGFSMFHGAINLFGSVYDQEFSIDQRLPFSLLNGNYALKVPPETTSNILYIGSYGIDSSLVYHDALTGNVHRTGRLRLEELASWKSISDWICVELPRLEVFYSPDGSFSKPRDGQLPFNVR